MTDDVIKLISQSYEKNKNGVSVPTATAKEVFCEIHSITRQEFYESGRQGLNPAFMVTMFNGDYEGEELLEYQDKTYSIYRTYLVPGTDYIELYVERKGGSNGKKSDP